MGLVSYLFKRRNPENLKKELERYIESFYNSATNIERMLENRYLDWKLDREVIKLYNSFKKALSLAIELKKLGHIDGNNIEVLSGVFNKMYNYLKNLLVDRKLYRILEPDTIKYFVRPSKITEWKYKLFPIVGSIQYIFDKMGNKVRNISSELKDNAYEIITSFVDSTSLALLTFKGLP